MRSLHLAWITETLTFAATFAPAALGPIIRENLALDKWQMGNAGQCGTLVEGTGYTCSAGPFLDDGCW
jgi:hypothetical protein